MFVLLLIIFFSFFLFFSFLFFFFFSFYLCCFVSFVAVSDANFCREVGVGGGGFTTGKTCQIVLFCFGIWRFKQKLQTNQHQRQSFQRTERSRPPFTATGAKPYDTTSPLVTAAVWKSVSLPLLVQSSRLRERGPCWLGGARRTPLFSSLRARPSWSWPRAG